MRTSFTSSLAVVIAATIGVLAATTAVAQQFVDGLAQPVFNVTGSNLITHSVWVEIPDLDTDRDGINDRIRVQIRRPAVTNGGTRLPVVMVASPYSGGQLPFPTYNINVPLYEPGKPGHYSHRRSYGGIMMSNPTLGTDPDTLFDNILTRKHPEVCAYMRDLIVQGAD